VTLRFPYDRLKADPTFADPSPFVYRPVVPIVLFGWTKSYPTKGILDTGSAETILPTTLWDDQLDPAFRDDEFGFLRGADGRPFRVTYGTVDLGVRLRRKFHRWHAKVAFSSSRNDILLEDAGFLTVLHGDLQPP
jgi:hypothetical protein